MKHLTLIVMLVLAAAGNCSAENAAPAAKLPFDNDMQRLSYAMGLDLARSLQGGGANLDSELLIKGIRDGYSGKVEMTPEQVAEIKRNFFKKRMEEQQAKDAEQQTKDKGLGEKNLADAQAFLTANKTKSGVKTTPSGLQYTVITEGSGETPKAEDTVKVHYRGTLLDGTQFDSSYDRNEPAVFSLNGVIKGWTEGLQLMKTGSKYKFFVPPDLAYGARRAGDKIGPNSALIFEVELLGIEKKAGPK